MQEPSPNIDVRAERLIPIPTERVAGYAMDWSHDHEWTQGIKEAKLTKTASAGGFGVGAEVTRTAYFMRKRIDYVLRVDTYDPPRILEMRSVAGPFPMHIVYEFKPQGSATLASIHIEGNTKGFYRLAGSLMARRVRASIQKDLQDLERNLSAHAG
jgi:polyketide cyclase/dehydrase/lipid transport protein